jgi:hypothetical protein
MPNWKYIWWDIEERWERLGLRSWVNNNPKIILGISIVTVIIFLLIVIAQCMPYNPPAIPRTHKAWFYDLNTNKLFVADSDNIPPIDAPSGKLPDGQPAGVKAYVFSYIREPNESERFIGYLEKYTPQGKKIISLFRKSKNNVTKDMVLELNKNRFVCKPSKQWFLADSNEGRVILKQVSRINEKGQIPNYYSPK